MPHDGHDHATTFQPDIKEPSKEWEFLEITLRELLIEKGIVTAREIADTVEAWEHKTPEDGARIIARAWVDDGLFGDRRLWFDVAPVELSHPDFPAEVAELVGAHPDIAIGFEMEDSRLMEDPVFVPIFERLQESGVELALDNVRPSSLSIGRLQRLPVSVINLDRELVRTLVTNPTNRELARLICSYAHDRGCPVTACQVETNQELDVAKLLEVDLVQGNVISRPLAADDLTELLLDLPTDG